MTRYVVATLHFSATEATLLRYLAGCGYAIAKLQDSYVLHKPGSRETKRRHTLALAKLRKGQYIAKR